MSAYLGFQPTKNPVYYFVSYNNEDAHRVGPIAKTMSHSGINLWYDHGIEYGDNWEITITERIQNVQAVILFFTKGILKKNSSYVQREYKIATQFYDRKVYVIMLDEIKKEEIPVEKVAWWIDINEKQCINGYEFIDTPKLVEKISSSLGIQNHEDKMNKIIDRYNELYHAGRITEAEACLSEYLHGISLMGKVHLVVNILCGTLQNTKLVSPANTIKGKLPKPFLTHMQRPQEQFYECQQITIHNDVFTIANDYVFHRGNRGDAHVIWIWKNDELIHTIGGLVEAYDLRVFWDSHDNIMYVAYDSEKEIYVDNKYVDSKTMISITTVENPNKQAVCSNFKYIE